MDEIATSGLDSDFRDEVARKIGLDKIKPCYTCGSCTGVCPVREVVEDFDPRVMIHQILLGVREELLSSDLIWLCCMCNSCYFVCPQEIKFSRVAAELQKMALEEGFADGEFLERLKEAAPYLQDLCRRTLFKRVAEGFFGPHTMPCWRKNTMEREER